MVCSHAQTGGDNCLLKEAAFRRDYAVENERIQSTVRTGSRLYERDGDMSELCVGR